MASQNDQEQYEAMRECMAKFHAHTMNLGDLIDELPQIVKKLEDVDPAWKSEFVSYWWTLEQIHGDAIDLGQSGRMPEGTRGTVDDAIVGLDGLINGASVGR